MGRGELVAILLPRDEYLITAILGIGKTGAGYLPIDVDYPRDRIGAILRDAGVGVLVTGHGRQKEWAAEPGLRVIDLPGEMAGILDRPAVGFANRARPADLAYVIYTSGSTGRPKGVMIAHGSLFNYSYWAWESYVGKGKAVFGLFTSISFDLTVTAVFVPLLKGGTIRIYGEEEVGSVLSRMLSEGKVEIIKLTPSHLRMIRELKLPVRPAEAGVLRFIVGGEELDRELALGIEEKFGGGVEIYNEYGPTETTVGCMLHRFDRMEQGLSVPIGVPGANNRIYLLDGLLQPVPVGVPAELYIGGKGVGLGYWQQEGLTAERFVPDPFVPGERMYKSGDLALRRRDGKVVYKGRIDDQVKIRGYRIEPGEIELQVSGYGGVREAAVVARGTGEDQYLAVYYVSDQEIGGEELRKYLSGRLPAYMVPTAYRRMEKLPLTTNGKLDRHSLPELAPGTGREYIGPGNETEQQLVAIWSEVLKVDAGQISITANFFELGGHSISILKLNERINQHFKCAISPADMFGMPTIKNMVDFLKQGRANKEKLHYDIEATIHEGRANLNLIEGR